MRPPRLHVIPAVACDMALILRRGPSGQVASLLWDRANGDLTLGQWLSGRIYEHRSDLSPDGRHMVYFAGKGGTRWWTALSRAPWLTALAFLPQDTTWHGGGAFDAAGQVWLNGGDAAGKALPKGLHPAPTGAFPHSTDGFHMGGLYAGMMACRGWRHIAGEGYDTELEKPLSGGWGLRLSFAVGKQDRAMISNRYTLLPPDTAASRPCPDWEWAEPWQDGLQIARQGTIAFLPLTATGLGRARLIHDLRGMSFEARPAPYSGVSVEGAP